MAFNMGIDDFNQKTDDLLVKENNKLRERIYGFDEELAKYVAVLQESVNLLETLYNDMTLNWDKRDRVGKLLIAVKSLIDE
jgi:hypothetical protein